MKKNIIPVIIPAYEPDERLIDLLKDLRKNKISPVIIVNDGSNQFYDTIFSEARKISDVMLTHKENEGKGKALKTAFSYVLENYPDSIGVVTADSDGQHSVNCIKKIINQLRETQKSLVLGVRDFDEEGIPWKSQFGNKLTRKLLSYVAGIKIKDSQTGLRGIPSFFLKKCLDLTGNRFEFETQMLLASSGVIDIIEVPIKTIYDSVENHQTHFNPIKDSINIYRVLGRQFLKYVFSSISSFIVDISLFMIFMFFLKNLDNSLRILLATGFSRVISIIYNYTMNYKLVFNSNKSVAVSVTKYLFLAVIQMNLSGIFVVGLNILFQDVSVLFLKIVVDTLLFIISYYIQLKFIFR